MIIYVSTLKETSHRFSPHKLPFMSPIETSSFKENVNCFPNKHKVAQVPWNCRRRMRRNSLVSQVIRLQLHFHLKKFGHLQNYRSILASNCMAVTFYDYSKIIRVSFCFYGSSPDSTPDPFSIEPERQGGGRSTRYYANSSFNSAG